MIGGGAACKPNISFAGRRMRRRFGLLGIAIVVVVLGAAVALRWPWYWRALLCIPVALSAISFLQARRGTCVSRAAEGTFEHEDFSTTKLPDTEVANSRRAAAAIVRDAVLIGLLSGLAATATTFLRW